jgi:hypothetical protein
MEVLRKTALQRSLMDCRVKPGNDTVVVARDAQGNEDKATKKGARPKETGATLSAAPAGLTRCAFDQAAAV